MSSSPAASCSPRSTSTTRLTRQRHSCATSAWAGEVGFDAIVEPFKKAAIARGNTLAYLSEAEYERWVKATEPVDDQWVKEVAAKGADGRKLLEEAKALTAQYSK